MVKVGSLNELNRLIVASDAGGVTANTVLVVDDSRGQRMLLSRILTKMGLRVLTADSGESALAVCQSDSPDLIISDWVMPGMDGLEFCRVFRETMGDRYGYFILLTSKDEKSEIATGLDAGADDFLTKPVNAGELRARIRAGQRVVQMERELTDKNGVITSALHEMKRLHARIDHDLQEAQKLQQSLVRDRFRTFGEVDVSLLLSPAGRVGGDLIGMFEVNADEIGVFALDVSGHGIASALMTARLASCFHGDRPNQNIAVRSGHDGNPVMRQPSDAAARLNDLVLSEIETDQYLTMVLARIRRSTGHVTLTQAGHPHPALMDASGNVAFVGNGGLPIGLLPGATYQDVDLTLTPGDRLFISSDGLTECMDPSGALLEDAGLARLLEKHANMAGADLFNTLIAELEHFSGTKEFTDDVSAAVIDYGPRKI